MDLTEIYGRLFGGNEPPVVDDYKPQQENRPFPADADIMAARKYNAFYGTPHEGISQAGGRAALPTEQELPNNNAEFIKKFPELSETSRKDIDDYISYLLTSEGLASNRSATASVGFDPYYPALLQGVGYGNSSGAVYHDDKNNPIAMYANLQDPGTLTHESIHKGMLELQREGLVPAASPEIQELVVRRIMQTVMGDVEKQNRPDKITQRLNDPNVTKVLDDYIQAMESAAQKYRVQKRPRGPR